MTSQGTPEALVDSNVERLARLFASSTSLPTQLKSIMSAVFNLPRVALRSTYVSSYSNRDAPHLRLTPCLPLPAASPAPSDLCRPPPPCSTSPRVTHTTTTRSLTSTRSPLAQRPPYTPTRPPTLCPQVRRGEEVSSTPSSREQSRSFRVPRILDRRSRSNFL